MVERPFVIASRSLFALPGIVLEGKLKPGLHVYLPLNNSMSISAPIEAVEYVDTSSHGRIAICLKYEDDSDLEFWSELNIGDEELEFGDPET